MKREAVRKKGTSSSASPSAPRTTAAAWIVGSVFALAIVAIFAVSSGIFTGLPVGGGGQCRDTDGGIV